MRHTVWVLGLYKLSWPANGSFKYVDMFFFFLFFFWWRGGRNVKGKGGSWGRGRRGYIVLCIH